MGSDNNQLAIYVKGDLEALVGVKIFEDNKELKAGWTIERDGHKKLTFSQPEGKNISMVVKFWVGLQRVSVPVTFEPKTR